MELEKPGFEFTGPPADRRPTIPVPPPVRVVAVEDVTLSTRAADQPAMDAFYVQLLKFDRDAATADPTYRAENVRLRINVNATPDRRDDLRALGIEVPSLADLEPLLIEAQIPFARERALTLGRQTLLLRDPAGNWLRLGEIKRIG